MSETSQNSAIRTAGFWLDDGNFVDIVRAQPGSSELHLLRSGDAAHPLISRTLRVGSRFYEAPDLPESLALRIHLATRPASYGSTRELYDGITKTLKSETYLADLDAEIFTCSVFATHFADCLDQAPVIAVAAAEFIDGLRMLRVGGALCRHAITLAGFRPGAVLTLPSGLLPTLMLSGGLRSSSMIDCLQASQAAGFGWLNFNGFAEGCSAKVVLIDDSTPDEVFQLASVSIYLGKTNRPLRNLDEFALRKIADRFLPRLLKYRLKHHRAVRDSTFDAPEFAGGIRTLAQTFGRCFPKDPELQKRVAELLHPKDEAARTTRRDRLDAIVVEALLVFCHEGKASVRVGEIAEMANTILEGRGERIQLSARKVGDLLNGVNIERRKTEQGYGFALLRETQLAIHARARALDVPTLRDGVARCEFCGPARAAAST